MKQIHPASITGATFSRSTSSALMAAARIRKMAPLSSSVRESDSSPGSMPVPYEEAAAQGLCGSGIVDAIAALLADLGEAVGARREGRVARHRGAGQQ